MGYQKFYLAIMVHGVKPSYDYDLHNQLLSNESDTIVQIANRSSKIKMSILTLSLVQFFSLYTATLSFLISDLVHRATSCVLCRESYLVKLVSIYSTLKLINSGIFHGCLFIHNLLFY